jgi:hypothetical protein
MSLDDPTLDVGAILWWYYPPELRQEFLEIVGYAHDKEFSSRMQVRMAMHCLNIILPLGKIVLIPLIRICSARILPILRQSWQGKTTHKDIMIINFMGQTQCGGSDE